MAVSHPEALRAEEPCRWALQTFHEASSCAVRGGLLKAEMFAALLFPGTACISKHGKLRVACLEPCDRGKVTGVCFRPPGWARTMQLLRPQLGGLLWRSSKADVAGAPPGAAINTAHFLVLGVESVQSLLLAHLSCVYMPSRMPLLWARHAQSGG